MSRWQPNAVQRLQQAAMELFLERGYEGTTVSDIAARAELTERTFFRYFTDKREVLFAGSEEYERFVVGAVAASTAEPLEAVIAAYEATAPALFDFRAEQVRQRWHLIAANEELLERELKKGGRVAAGITAALVAKGVSPTAAALAAEVGSTVFRNAFDRWVADTSGKPLAGRVRATLAELKSVIGAAD
jgi:AcrR family transcriptional regulator